MKCPVDGNDLVMSERQNVEIDYCPSCRGVWLDRGELDKIIEKVAASEASAAAPAPAPQPVAPQPQQPRYDDRQYDDRKYDDRRYDQSYSGKPKKKSHWLGELFD